MLKAYASMKLTGVMYTRIITFVILNLIIFYAMFSFHALFYILKYSFNKWISRVHEKLPLPNHSLV